MNLKLAIIGMSTLAVSACVSILPEPTVADALYSIEAEADLSGLSTDLIVREPDAPRLMSGQAIVSLGGDSGLRMVPGVEWSGPATRQIQLAIIDSFKTQDTGNAVLPELGIFTDYELATQLSVLRLEGQTGVCEMVVSVIATNNRSLMARTEISSSERARSDRSSDRALALRAAATDCATQAAQFAIKTLDDAD